MDQQNHTAIEHVAVIGAGTMGAGIAQVAALAGCAVTLYDIEQAFIDRGLARITQSLATAQDRGKLDAELADAAKGRIQTGTDLGRAVESAQLVIEAVPEDLALKQDLFARLETHCQRPDVVLASNTSSISIALIGAKLANKANLAGLHFFNPVPQMKLVEIIQGQQTGPAAIDALRAFVLRLGKTPVLAKDTPGFIVNRVARPFYGEALKILGEHRATAAEVDAAMREVGGFRMGPFELMDLIGIDVNFAVTQSVYHAYFQEPRYRPHVIQQAMVAANLLGKKTGEGFYRYDAQGQPQVKDASPPAGTPPGWRLSPEQIFRRILSMIVNEAYSALMENVASAGDIDTAMRLGTNYPQGPLAWGESLGLETVLATLDDLHGTYREERYRPVMLLQETVRQRQRV